MVKSVSALNDFGSGERLMCCFGRNTKLFPAQKKALSRKWELLFYWHVMELGFWFSSFIFQASFFKTCRSIACSFLHLHWCTDTYDSEHLNVWCFGLIFVESRGEFWEVPVFVYPDLSSHGVGVSWLPDTLSILSGWSTAHLTSKILVIVWLKVAL